MELREYQLSCAAKAQDIIKRLGLAYLAMEVRTGKTLTALEVARAMGAKRVAFITKIKAITSIRSDYEALRPGYELDCTNYESIHKLRPGHDFAIIDEAHSLGAFPKPSLRTKRLRERFYSVPMLFLSGTPTPEGYSQIYHQLWISQASPFKHRNFYRWADEYVVKKEKQLNGFTFIDYSGAIEDKVKAVIEPYFVTYTQEQAGFKCEVQEHFVDVIAPIVPAYIRTIFKDRILTLEDGRVILADSPAKVMSKMHQTSGGSIICEDDTTAILTDTKAWVIKDRFAGMRIAIYYKFIGERTILNSTFGDQLTEIPEEFQQDPKKIFVSQILSGREGIALSMADAIVFYNVDYSATSYLQARARLQSLERSTPANIYWMMTQGGLESRVYRAVSKKLDFTYGYFMRTGFL